jgi:hypothetical protein
MFRHYIAILRERSWSLLTDDQLRFSRLNIVDGCVVSRGFVRGDLVCYAAKCLYTLGSVTY